MGARPQLDFVVPDSAQYRKSDDKWLDEVDFPARHSGGIRLRASDRREVGSSAPYSTPIALLTVPSKCWYPRCHGHASSSLSAFTWPSVGGGTRPPRGMPWWAPKDDASPLHPTAGQAVGLIVSAARRLVRCWFCAVYVKFATAIVPNQPSEPSAGATPSCDAGRRVPVAHVCAAASVASAASS